MSSLGIDPGILSAIAVLISIFALLTNVLTFRVNSQNQAERRHGEIARIRSESLMKLSAIHNRLFYIQLHIADARKALPHMLESDVKNIAEELTRLVDETNEKTREQTAKLNKYLEQIDTTRGNKTSVMLFLQSTEQSIKFLDCKTNELEQKALEFLNMIRSKQESAYL
jgi:hypothetical protein